MKLLILGATGPTGQQLVKQSLEKHHQVIALVRDPAKLNIHHDNLSIIKGDVLDKSILTMALESNDAVLSALGVGKTLRSSNLMQGAMTNLIAAMNTMNIKRIIFLSAFGVGETFAQADFIQKIIFRTLLKNIYTDKAKADTMLQQSLLDWTIVSPVVLTNGPYTGKSKAGEILPMKGLPIISRADVADFMLQQLTDTSYLKKTVVLKS